MRRLVNLQISLRLEESLTVGMLTDKLGDNVCPVDVSLQFIAMIGRHVGAAIVTTGEAANLMLAYDMDAQVTVGTEGLTARIALPNGGAILIRMSRLSMSRQLVARFQEVGNREKESIGYNQK